MNLVDHTVTDFIEEIDSSSPAPGGGSVSALSGAIGASLARMVGHLTVTKKAYQKLSDEQRETFEQTLHRFEEIKLELVPLVDKDTEAFNEIMKAYKLPKESDTEQSLRKQAIEEATIGAIEVPMKVAKLSIEGLKLLKVIEDFGNKNCLSDIGVSALQLGSAAQGALMNVKINVSSLSNEETKLEYTNEVNNLFEKANLMTNFLSNKIFELL